MADKKKILICQRGRHFLKNKTYSYFKELLNDYDVDIYVKFNYQKFKDNENISEILYKILKKKFKKVVRLHGSRDYFQIK